MAKTGSTANCVAPVVRFLASPESQYMTGQVIGVNGGMDW
jgi:3-oxoacyl-[acyl-carrier protein] reductase